MNRAEKALAVISSLQREGIIQQYAIGGAIGAAFYIEPTNTGDIDIFVHIPPEKACSLTPFKEITDALAARGFDQWEKEGVIVHGWPIQFLPIANTLEKEALDHAIATPFGNTKVYVVTPEHLMAIAVATGRPKDKWRILQFIHTPGSYDPAKLDTILSRHHLTKKFKHWRKELSEKNVLDSSSKLGTGQAPPT